ncbi:MAG: hypothetical protein ACR2O6_07475 [Ilumatobacteraceae bacterium]
MGRRDRPALPAAGVRLEHDELVAVIAAVRAPLGGTDPGDVNRGPVLTIAAVLADAVERERGTT